MDGNKLSEALARLTNAPGVSIRQLAKTLASYKKNRKKFEKNGKMKRKNFEKNSKF